MPAKSGLNFLSLQRRMTNMESQRSFSDITRRLIVFTVATLLTACGGGGGGGYGGGGGGGGGGTTYTISGTVIGLASAGSVVLQDNGSDTRPAVAHGAFTFATPVNAFAAY